MWIQVRTMDGKVAHTVDSLSRLTKVEECGHVHCAAGEKAGLGVALPWDAVSGERSLFAATSNRGSFLGTSILITVCPPVFVFSKRSFC